jgi:hypothetical protein
MTEEPKKSTEPIEMPQIDVKNLDVKNAFQQFVRIIKLDKQAVEDVSKDKKGDTVALFSLILGAIASPLAMGIFGITVLGITIRPNLTDVVMQSVLAIIMAGLTLFITSMVALKLFKGHGSFSEYFRVGGLVYGLNVLGILSFIVPSFGPLIGLVIGIWMLVINYIAIKTIFKLDDTNTVLTMIVTIIVFFLLAAVIGSAGFGVMSSSANIPSFSFN